MTEIETFKKIAAEIAQKMAAALASDDAKSVIEQTKAASETGSFEVIISTADYDRQGESVDQRGWDLSHYMDNPVVLWGHDYYSLPIGICESLELRDGNLIARGKFAPEAANPFAQQVRRLYDLKIVRATSVGFIVKEMEGKRITKAELLEFSFVPVPANPYALSLAQAKQLDLGMIAAKGLKLEVTEKAMGDDCTMEDGTPGMMEDDGEGGMVCKPKAVKAEGDTCTLDDGTEGVYDSEGVCKPKAAAADKEKGEVAADLEAVKQRQEKWNRLGKVLDVIDAFIGVYMDEATPVEDFQKLLDETIGLLKGDVAKILAVAERKYLNVKKTLDVSGKKDAQQIGAVLSAAVNEINDILVQASRLILDIVATYGQTDEAKAEIAEALTSLNAIDQKIAEFKHTLGLGEGEEQPGGAALKERSENAEEVATLSALDEYLKVRDLLRVVATAAGASLEGMNKKIPELKKALRK